MFHSIALSIATMTQIRQATIRTVSSSPCDITNCSTCSVASHCSQRSCDVRRIERYATLRLSSGFRTLQGHPRVAVVNLGDGEHEWSDLLGRCHRLQLAHDVIACTVSRESEDWP